MKKTLKRKTWLLIIMVCVLMTSVVCPLPISAKSAKEYELKLIDVDAVEIHITGYGSLVADYKEEGGTVYIGAFKNGASVLYDTDNHKIVADCSKYFSSGKGSIYPIKTNGKTYFIVSDYESDDVVVINKEGKIIREFTGELQKQEGNLIAVYSEGFVQIYNVEENSLKSDVYLGLSRFSKKGGYGKLQSNGKWYWIDGDGNRTNKTAPLTDNQYIYEYIGNDLYVFGDFQPDYWWMYNTTNAGLIDSNGNIVVEPKYRGFGVYSDGRAGIMSGEPGNWKMGYIDTKGEIVIPLIYSDITTFWNGVARVWHPEKGDIFINLDNEEVDKNEVKTSRYVFEYRYGVPEDGFVYEGSVIMHSTGEEIEFSESGMTPYLVGDSQQKIIVEADGKFYELIVDSSVNKDFEEISFSDATYAYNGQEQSVTVGGVLPEGAKVEYENNKGLDCGTYKAIAKITCDGYNPLTLTATMKIEPAKISIKADNKQMVLNGKVPEFTYTVTEGKLFGDDKITGELKTKATGTKIGQFDIEKGTLSVGSNYDLTFEKGILEVVEKTPQNITVSDIEEKTYGDGVFVVTVTPDEKSGLNEFTFKSDNTDVAEISEDGIITIKGAGEANIIVRQEGNEEYAPTEKVQKLVVNKKEIILESINIDEKTAVLTGVLDSDVSEVGIDFKKSSFEILESIDETKSKILVKETVLSGEKAQNYTCVSETFETTVSNENIISVDVIAENGAVSGMGSYIKDNEVVLTAQPDTRYKFSGWYMDGKLVSKEATYTLVSNENVVIEAKFTKKSTGGLGGGGSTSYTVKFESNGGSKISNKSAGRNAVISEPAAPIKEGYVFKGWFEDKELTKKYDFNSKVVKSITLYASWEDIKTNQIILTIGNKDAMVFGNKKSNDVAPIIKKDRTMLPARFVAESLGAEVLWNDGIVSISKDDIEITIEIGKAEAIVNGKTVKLDSPAFIENDRTYTPIRFISEALGADVDWNEKTQEVIITKK